MKILFVCLGNVARSQMAEAFYNHMTRSAAAKSAGTLDYTPAKYVHPAKEVVEVMREEGIDVSEKTVKTVTPAMVAAADRIFVMCRKDECPSFLVKSRKVTFCEIEDPHGKKMDDLRKTRDIIKARISRLVKG